jgi:hypothetical protein
MKDKGGFALKKILALTRNFANPIKNFILYSQAISNSTFAAAPVKAILGGPPVDHCIWMCPASRVINRRDLTTSAKVRSTVLFRRGRVFPGSVVQ